MARGDDHGVLQHNIDTDRLTFHLHLSCMIAIAEVDHVVISIRGLTCLSSVWFTSPVYILRRSITFVTITFCNNYSLSCYAQHVYTLAGFSHFSEDGNRV